MPLSMFSIIGIFIGIPSGSLCGGDGPNDTTNNYGGPHQQWCPWRIGRMFGQQKRFAKIDKQNTIKMRGKRAYFMITIFRQLLLMTSRQHKEACRSPFDSLVSPCSFIIKTPHLLSQSVLVKVKFS